MAEDYFTRLVHSVDRADADDIARGRAGLVSIPLAQQPRVMPITWLLITGCIASFAVQVAQSGSIGDTITGSPLALGGSLAAQAVADGEVVRLLSHAFLHIGIVHLLLNMVGLFVIGRQLEPRIGSARFAMIYIAAVLGSAACSLVFESSFTLMAGASGGIYGLLGATLVYEWWAYRHMTPILLILLGLGVLEFFGEHGQVAVYAHAGGLLMGSVAMWVAIWCDRTTAPFKVRAVPVLGALGAALVIVGMLAASSVAG